MKQKIYIYIEGMLHEENKEIFYSALRLLKRKFEYRLLPFAVIEKGTLYSRPMKIEDIKVDEHERKDKVGG